MYWKKKCMCISFSQPALSQLIEDKGAHCVVKILKSVNVKTVIYMSAEFWDKVARSTLIKSLKKLWPSVCDLPENKTVPLSEINAREKYSSKVQFHRFVSEN